MPPSATGTATATPDPTLVRAAAIAFCQRVGTGDPRAYCIPGSSPLSAPLWDNGVLVDWRCFEGEVLGCPHTGTGDGCMVMDRSTTPLASLVQYCQDHPGKAPPPVATGRATVFAWLCVGTTPEIGWRIVHDSEIDAPGYLIKTWHAIGPVIAQGSRPKP